MSISTPEISKVKDFQFTDSDTPSKSKYSPRLAELLQHSNEKPSPPNSPIYQVRYKDYQSAIGAIQQLEAELNEFQTSSYELEKELEKELLDLDNDNADLKQQIKSLTDELRDLRMEGIQKDKASNAKISTLNEQIKGLQNEIQNKNSHLIDIEILNDNIEQNERNLKVLYRELEESYSRSLEDAIILETEANETKDLLLKERLNHQNTKNELNDWKTNYEDLLTKYKSLQSEVQQKQNSSSQTTHSNYNRRTSASSVGSITGQRSSSMTKSNSLMQLHSMIEQTKGMENKIDNLKISLKSNSKNLKYNSLDKTRTTTKLTNTSITTTTPSSSSNVSTRQRSSSSSSSKRKIPLSPSSYKLSSLTNEKADFEKLDKIEGSPNKDPVFKKKNGLRFGGFLKK